MAEKTAPQLKKMVKIKLTFKGNGDAPHGPSVTCWPVDKAGWAKHGYFPEGEEAPANGIGTDLQKNTVEELKDIAQKETVKISSDDKKIDIINKILKARADESGAE